MNFVSYEKMSLILPLREKAFFKINFILILLSLFLRVVLFRGILKILTLKSLRVMKILIRIKFQLLMGKYGYLFIFLKFNF
jgi:hypothetical protein